MVYRRGCFGVLNLDGLEDEPLRLLDGGIERRYRERYDYCNDKRPDYEGCLFQYTLKGQGRYCLDGKEWQLKEGMAFLTAFPENSRYYLPKEQEEGWEFLYLHFEGPGAGPFMKRLASSWGSVIALGPQSAPVRMALKLQERLVGGGRLEKYEGGEFLYRFLCAVLREAEQPSLGKDSLAGKGAQIMETEYGLLDGVEEVAARLNVSQAHFSRVFRQEMGMTPIRYLTRLRLQGAMNDLLNTQEGLSQIAGRNGFSGGNYFCKAFRRYVGMSPMEYRRNRNMG